MQKMQNLKSLVDFYLNLLGWISPRIPQKILDVQRYKKFGIKFFFKKPDAPNNGTSGTWKLNPRPLEKCIRSIPKFTFLRL